MGNTYGDDPTRATIVVTSGALQANDYGQPPTTIGHMTVLDCGPGTWNPNAADWPQLGRTAQRTGTLGLP